MMYKVGLTGGIASGKSTVSQYLEFRGYPIIDADKIAKQIMEPKSKEFIKVIEVFGEEILDENGRLNRSYLSQLVFNDEIKRQQLNQITHPLIHEEIIRQLSEFENQGRPLIFMDVPLLFESGFERLCDEVWLVWINLETQYQRLMERNQLTQSEAKSIISSQMALEDKKKLADFLINNNGNLKETYQEIDSLLNRLNK